MTTTNLEASATKWHRKPAGHKGPCPVCGLREYGLCRAQHRAIGPGEKHKAKWLKRKGSQDGWVVSPVIERTGKKGPKPGTIIRPHAPTPRVAKLMGEAAALVVHGKTIAEAAKALDVPTHHVWGWKNTWKEIWQMLVDKTAKSLVATVQAMAGRDAILRDADAYLDMAEFVDDWAKKNGVTLFSPPDGEMTLSQFYEEWYLPQKLFDAKEGTKGQYRYAIKAWRLITADPAIKDITPKSLALFRDVQLKLRGQKPYLRRSPNSVRSKMRAIQTLLDKLGPPARGNRDALDILKRVPWAQQPKAEEKVPRVVPLQLLSDCYQAAVAMEKPHLPGVKAPAWWKALLVVAWNTGLRRGTLFSMRWDDVNWKDHQLVLPGARMKSRRPMIVHLNGPALEALRSIRTDRELIFPWSRAHIGRYFHELFHKLQDAAGIPVKDHFGLHNIRKTVATTLWDTNPGAAQFALGHATSDVTRKHYVDGGPMVARALDALPQPEAFTKSDKPSDERGAA
jgi:integrase